MPDKDIMLALGRLEGKVDALIQGQAAQGEKLNKHDERIRALEHYKAWIMGGAAAAGAVTSLLVRFLTS